MIGEELLLRKPLPTWLGQPLPVSSATIGVDTSTSLGTQLAAGAGANTKGNWTELSSSTPINADAFTLVLSHVTPTAIHMIDIALGPSGSEVALVQSLAFDLKESSGSPALTIPLAIPKGSRVTARYQDSSTLKTVDVSIVLHKNHPLGALGLKTAETWGADLSTSTGTAMATPASINTKGAWTEMTSGTSARTRMLMLLCGLTAVSVNDTGILLDIGAGSSGNEVPVIENIVTYMHNSADRAFPCVYLFPVDLPAGTRLSLRQQTSLLATLIDCILIGFS